MVKVDFFWQKGGMAHTPAPPEYATCFERNVKRNNELRESGARMNVNEVSMWLLLLLLLCIVELFC